MNSQHVLFRITNRVSRLEITNIIGIIKKCVSRSNVQTTVRCSFASWSATLYRYLNIQQLEEERANYEHEEEEEEETER